MMFTLFAASIAEARKNAGMLLHYAGGLPVKRGVAAA